MALYRVNKPRHAQTKFHVKKNDEVVILSGTQQGKRGKLPLGRFGGRSAKGGRIKRVICVEQHVADYPHGTLPIPYSQEGAF